MLAKLEAVSKQDADAGKPRNHEREEYMAALADAADMMNDYQHTGAPASWWAGGQQQSLFSSKQTD